MYQTFNLVMLFALLAGFFVLTALPSNALAAEPGCNRIKQQFENFGGTSPSVLEEQCAAPGGFIKRVINIALGLAGSLAVLFLIVAAFRYVTAGGNTTVMASARKNMLWSFIGLLVIILAYTIVSIVSRAVTTNSLGL